MKSVKKALFLLFAIYLYSCATASPVMVEAPEKPEEIAKAPDYVTIVAFGDNLYHAVMVQAGEEGDYEGAYREILPLLEKADIAFINQETLLAGKE